MNCPVCNNSESKKMLIRNQETGSSEDRPALMCKACKTIFAEDYQKDRSGLYSENYAPWSDDSGYVAESKTNTFKSQLSLALPYIAPKGKKLLDAGTAKGYLMTAASQLGFDVYGFDISKSAIDSAKKVFPNKVFCGTIEDADYKDSEFDMITTTDILEHLVDPHKFMEKASQLVKKGGLLLIITPNSGSITRKILRKNWYQYKEEHIIYYNKKSLAHLLKKHGFELVFAKANTKTFSLKYTYEYVKKYKIAVMGSIFAKVFPLLPEFVKNASFSNPMAGEIIALARKT